ncbi:zinc-ribbon domain-containing protein [Schleiferilactobacillus harbinensis]|uniref:zinc-ribbon domain-containing protein n=1 Tax=Schleiferilactobacillus harbinensis TaxID=304207 RepID=UPI00168AA637|nr:zinc ribbon domain-containing protein [Schleiferilactobacillus harbinensis]
MHYCPYCGAKVQESSKFCPSCGHKLAIDQQPSSQPNQAAPQQSATRQSNQSVPQTQAGNNTHPADDKLIYWVTVLIVVIISHIAGMSWVENILTGIFVSIIVTMIVAAVRSNQAAERNERR